MPQFSTSFINKMSIYICFSALILISTIFTYVSPQDPIRQYVIRKDFFIGFKAGEFTVYDTSEKNIQYRIESDYGITQNVRLIAHPSKQLVGRLQAKFTVFLYEGEISIIDSQTNQWINGVFKQNFKLLTSSFNIDWNGRSLTGESELGSVTVKFRDTNGELLAQFRLRPVVFLKRKYDMKIFSNKYPDQLYLLALAAYDHIHSTKKNG